MSHPPGLLRARRKHPRHPCASNQRDERTASFHTSPAAVGDAAPTGAQAGTHKRRIEARAANASDG
jgi:hypothetical protein